MALGLDLFPSLQDTSHETLKRISTPTDLTVQSQGSLLPIYQQDEQELRSSRFCALRFECCKLFQAFY